MGGMGFGKRSNDYLQPGIAPLFTKNINGNFLLIKILPNCTLNFIRKIEINLPPRRLS